MNVFVIFKMVNKILYFLSTNYKHLTMIWQNVPELENNVCT